MFSFELPKRPKRLAKGLVTPCIGSFYKRVFGLINVVLLHIIPKIYTLSIKVKSSNQMTTLMMDKI